MITTTILQHSETHPLILLGMVLRAPVYLDASITSFRIRSEDHFELSASIKGVGFRYDTQMTPTAGTMSGIVLHEEHQIVAQFIDCSIPASLLGAVSGNASAVAPDRLGQFLDLNGINPLILR